MNYLKGFFVSLSIHLLVFGVFIFGVKNLGHIKDNTRTVDISAFTFEKPEIKPVVEEPKKTVLPKKEESKPPKPKTLPPQKKIEKVVAPPVVPEKVQAPVEMSEPKLVSDTGMKEYVPVAVPESGKPEPFSGTGYVGKPSEETAQESAPVKSTGGNAASNYMKINLDALRKSIYGKLIYPRQAKMMGLKGVTDLRFRILKNGSVEKITVYKSSGYTILDDAARDAVLDAAPLPVPTEEITIVLSVSFTLK
ncbi:TonB family protein [Seleniivibrio sp.]|uniref:energy transducer TonB n=1 Tax=Seleniivibrio sp. TaxID=2898801 RepID=UPI0025F60F43|nr:TonB family protein [Seleniivibrio sp.]MCD8553572.1 TonB family protein [Seleniivibrio sp.]